MNENIDLTKILKDCPTGTKLYSSVHGEVEFERIETTFGHLYVVIRLKDLLLGRINLNGKLYNSYNGECILFPSKDQRDWSKFVAPWYNKEKFDPRILKPFDKIIARVEGGIWFYELLSFIGEGRNIVKGLASYYNYCVPYNDETKHLVGTTEEAPEYYRYWED